METPARRQHARPGVKIVAYHAPLLQQARAAPAVDARGAGHEGLRGDVEGRRKGKRVGRGAGRSGPCDCALQGRVGSGAAQETGQGGPGGKDPAVGLAVQRAPLRGFIKLLQSPCGLGGEPDVVCVEPGAPEPQGEL